MIINKPYFSFFYFLQVGLVVVAAAVEGVVAEVARGVVGEEGGEGKVAAKEEILLQEMTIREESTTAEIL